MYQANGTQAFGAPLGYDQLVELDDGDDFTSSPAGGDYDNRRSANDSHDVKCARYMKRERATAGRTAR